MDGNHVDWINALAALQGRGAMGVDGDGAPDGTAPLYHIARAITNVTLELLARIAPFFGIDYDPGAGTSVARALAALVFVLPVTGLIVFLVSRALKFRIRRSFGDKVAQKRAALESMLSPVAFLIWILGITVGLSPLLKLAAEQADSVWIFALMRSVVIGATGISLMWFWYAFGKRLRKWASAPLPDGTVGYRDIVVRVITQSLNAVVPLVIVLICISMVGVRENYRGLVTTAIGIFVILVVSWVLTQIILSFESLILRRYKLADEDNLVARKVFTQVHVIQRVALFLVGFLAIASVLLLFPAVRQFGQTILASAGIAGIVIGLAMQRTLGNLFAGIQIAFTQPIRIDDVVVVENEWGRIEEITLSYVVVKIWDWRRLVLPISYFIEKPFQNWTRSSASVIGTIFIYVDYRLPIAEFREASDAILKKHPLWDGQVSSLQVTECKEQTVEVRMLVSAVDSPKAWDLRCDVRESMLDWVQKNYPGCLPRLRIEHESTSRERGSALHSPADLPQQNEPK